MQSQRPQAPASHIATLSIRNKWCSPAPWERGLSACMGAGRVRLGRGWWPDGWGEARPPGMGSGFPWQRGTADVPVRAVRWGCAMGWSDPCNRAWGEAVGPITGRLEPRGRQWCALYGAVRPPTPSTINHSQTRGLPQWRSHLQTCAGCGYIGHPCNAGGRRGNASAAVLGWGRRALPYPDIAAAGRWNGQLLRQMYLILMSFALP